MADAFYDEGLHFSCTRCSACCRGGPGYVFLAKSDLRRLLSRLGLDFPTFFKRYCVLVETGIGFELSLAERPNYDCVFWGEDGCTVYEDRPIQCSTFPFWASIVASKENWTDAGLDCPGIGKGELRSREYIQELLWRRRAEGAVVISAAAALKPEDIDADSILGS